MHIPYKGQGPAMMDVLGGTVSIAFETTTAATPQLSSKRIRVDREDAAARFAAEAAYLASAVEHRLDQVSC